MQPFSLFSSKKRAAISYALPVLPASTADGLCLTHGNTQMFRDKINSRHRNLRCRGTVPAQMRICSPTLIFAFLFILSYFSVRINAW